MIAGARSSSAASTSWSRGAVECRRRRPRRSGGPASARRRRRRPVDVLVNNVGAARPGSTASSRSPTSSGSRRSTSTCSPPSARRAPRCRRCSPRPRARSSPSARSTRSSRPGRHRLQRGEGRARQLLQGAVEGGRAAGHPRQHREPGPGRRPSCGSATSGVAETVAQGAPASDRRRRRRPAADAAATGRFTRPTRSPTSSCCWPATAPPTSPAPTSPSTAA